jgi:hypothetical protein
LSSHSESSPIGRISAAFKADGAEAAGQAGRQSRIVVNPSMKEARPMKTMTCQQLGGPCDLPHRGETADQVIKAQDRHLKEVVAGGDTSHENALNEMKGRWRHPISGMGWYKQAKRDFAALPED